MLGRLDRVEGRQGSILKVHCLCAHSNPLNPIAPLLRAVPFPPTSSTCGWERGPEREAGAETVAQILPAYPGVGDDGQAGACPVLGDAGLLIGCLGAALDEHQVQEGVCAEREAGQGGVRLQGPRGRVCIRKGAEEAPGRLRCAPPLVFRGAVF